MPVFEPCVPADVVPVQMRAHDIVDLFGPDPGGREIGDVGGTQPVELWPGRALLVVAEAGIDQDRVVRGLDHKTVKAEHELTGRRIDQPRTGHVRVGLQYLRVEIREEILGADKRALVLGDAPHLEIADPRDLHDPASAFRCEGETYAGAWPRSIGRAEIRNEAW